MSKYNSYLRKIEFASEDFPTAFLSNDLMGARGKFSTHTDSATHKDAWDVKVDSFTRDAVDTAKTLASLDERVNDIKDVQVKLAPNRRLNIYNNGERMGSMFIILGVDPRYERNKLPNGDIAIAMERYDWDDFNRLSKAIEDEQRRGPGGDGGQAPASMQLERPVISDPKNDNDDEYELTDEERRKIQEELRREREYDDYIKEVYGKNLSDDEEEREMLAGYLALLVNPGRGNQADTWEMMRHCLTQEQFEKVAQAYANFVNDNRPEHEKGQPVFLPGYEGGEDIYIPQPVEKDRENPFPNGYRNPYLEDRFINLRDEFANLPDEVKRGIIVEPLPPKYPDILADPLPPKDSGIIVEPLAPELPNILADPLPPKGPDILIDPLPPEMPNIFYEKAEGEDDFADAIASLGEVKGFSMDM